MLKGWEAQAQAQTQALLLFGARSSNHNGHP